MQRCSRIYCSCLKKTLCRIRTKITISDSLVSSNSFVDRKKNISVTFKQSIFLMMILRFDIIFSVHLFLTKFLQLSAACVTRKIGQMIELRGTTPLSLSFSLINKIFSLRFAHDTVQYTVYNSWPFKTIKNYFIGLRQSKYNPKYHRIFLNLLAL